MRKILSIIVCVFALSFVCMTVYAHPGRTDSNGGHTDHSTGEYHYHHGYPAHDHYDMDGDGIPDCPYKFEDITSQNKSSHSSNSATSDSTNKLVKENTSPQPLSRETEDASTSKKDVKEVPDWVYWIFCILALSVLCLSVSNKWKKDEIKQWEISFNREINKEKEQKEKYETKINDIKMDLASQEHRYEIKLEEYKENLRTSIVSIDHSFRYVRGSDYLYYLVGAPDGDTVGSDGLPRSQDCTKHKWGDKYTFYIALDSKSVKFHAANCAHKGGVPVNAYFLSKKYIRTPCKFCNPQIPNLSWYFRYKEIMDFNSEYLETDFQKKENSRCNRTN